MLFSFLPSESINSKKLDPTTEAAIQRATSREAAKSGKSIDEYEVKMVDKNGRSITYNSVEGIIATSSNYSIYFELNILKIILISLILFLN